MSKIVVLEQDVPFYLKELLREDIQCRIVFSQLPHSPILPFPIISACTSPYNEEPSFQELNTTPEFDPCKEENVVTDGTLQIKLDESSLEIVDKLSPQRSCTTQSTSEEQHYPLDQTEARILLGTKYNKIKSEIPTLCIVRNENKGEDNKQKQVVLGGQNTTDFIKTYAIFAYDIELMNSDSLKWDKWEKMVMKHPYATMEHNFRRVYNIYKPVGKENMNFEDNEASMVLETCWNQPVEEEPCFYQTSLKLKMQVVSGHHKSSIRCLWDELKQLETYLNVLDDECALKIGSTSISHNHSTASELAENIHNLCTNPIKRRKNAVLLCVDDLRELTILDRLWSILIRCKDLIDLKNCLSTFFRIVNMENLVNRDRAVELVKDLDIQDYMVNLTLSESLKFLVAIGFEKLKNDYLAIVTFYNPIHQVGLEHIWRKYCVAKKVEIRRKSLAPNQPKYFALTDTTFNQEKMALLSKLHDASEFVMFLKNNLLESIKFSDYNFGRICNEVYLKFVFDNEGLRCSEQLTPTAVAINCNLDSKNEELYKNQIPVKKIYETRTRIINNKINKDESVHTILVSRSPIFPECICDNSVVESNKDLKKGENSYFVAVLQITKFGLF